ncbi:hypothetical protein C8R44DRAFT_862166 [Mycena epipterygia]|nr:hypothetical protein C8R44DRAFT_862166 [Mycena epipterygia]
MLAEHPDMADRLRKERVTSQAITSSSTSDSTSASPTTTCVNTPAATTPANASSAADTGHAIDAVLAVEPELDSAHDATKRGSRRAALGVKNREYATGVQALRRLLWGPNRPRVNAEELFGIVGGDDPLPPLHAVFLDYTFMPSEQPYSALLVTTGRTLPEGELARDDFVVPAWPVYAYAHQGAMEHCRASWTLAGMVEVRVPSDSGMYAPAEAIDLGSAATVTAGDGHRG